ncbi:putative exonuclease 3'-5' domain-containing protein 2 [Apostichopus japonicus]|uniref:Putative exonuclease 3'-5' domain-containing protein 2 n=1 Tax=Stichopus japonicus TaxID=307972 RepID=A0A2G8JJU1_STIJA|nr:putative exonuclease 3'-5' domain-containing protein 2 [Apostichopus japonicus]
MALTNYRGFFLAVAVVAATAGMAVVIFLSNRKRRAKNSDPRKVLGMDCEWTTSDHSQKANPVALLQLATPKGLCVLFRLCKIRGHKELQGLGKILNDRSILKVGVGILSDAKKLAQDYGFSTKGCIDLRHLALRHLPRGHSVTGGSLAELARVCLNYDLDKLSGIRCSNWDSHDFTPEQVRYAAMDACVGLAIFYELVTSKLPGGSHGEVDWWSVSALCQGLVDAKFKGTFMSHICNDKNHNGKGKKKKKEVQTLEQLREKPLSKVYIARKEPLYDNCKLVSPDGTLLCTCDRGKAEWYVNKDIGEIVTEDPLVVQLKFKPRGIPGPDREYYLQEKSNMCVVCGRTDSYIRKNIVPHEYRRHFPDYLKKHSSHDILLLCVECHQCSWTFDSTLRYKLAEEYDAPINNLSNAPTKEDPVKAKVKSSAKALLRHKINGNLPVQRRCELENTVKKHFDASIVDQEMLQSAANMDTRVSNELFEMTHGEKVVGATSREADGFAKFERRWRVHFLSTMQPRFMPDLWSVDHKHESQVAKREIATSLKN